MANITQISDNKNSADHEENSSSWNIGPKKSSSIFDCDQCFPCHKVRKISPVGKRDLRIRRTGLQKRRYYKEIDTHKWGPMIQHLTFVVVRHSDSHFHSSTLGLHHHPSMLWFPSSSLIVMAAMISKRGDRGTGPCSPHTRFSGVPQSPASRPVSGGLP